VSCGINAIEQLCRGTIYPSVHYPGRRAPHPRALSDRYPTTKLILRGPFDPLFTVTHVRYEEPCLTQRASPAIARNHGGRQETIDSPNAIHARVCVKYSAR
jgi:hypothetical protein